jgi:hypothetical protein
MDDAEQHERRLRGVAAMKAYLESRFTSQEIADLTAMPARQAHEFRVVAGSDILFRAFVSFTALEGDPDRLVAQIREQGLADKMQAAGARGVLVTDRITPA